MTNLAFVFPGQGSQRVGMLAELAARYSLIKDSFISVSERLGYDLWLLTQNGPESMLNQTEHTQAAMLTADVAIYRLLETLGLRQVKMMAGHSLGEYAALVCAGALSLEDGVELVSKRGQVMQKFVPLGQGAMAAIVGMSDEEVESICMLASSTNSRVAPANYNAIGQIVIAGHTDAVKQALTIAEERGASLVKIIPVSVPCHCSLLKDAALAFEEDLAKTNFKTPIRSVISNVDLSIYKTAEQIRILLKEQLYLPVRWVETIQLMKRNGIESVIECGPGRVLSGLTKRIERDLYTTSVNDPASLEQAAEQLLVGELLTQ